MNARSRPVAAILSLLLVASGCVADGLAFRQDHRLVIVTPHDRSDSTVPFEVEWNLIRPQADEVRFAVLVDRFAPRPGQSIESLLPAELREPARCDAACRSAALASRNIFVTDRNSLTITRLPVRRGVSEERRRRHEISVIVLDGQLRRAGEAVAWIEVDAAEVAP